MTLSLFGSGQTLLFDEVGRSRKRVADNPDFGKRRLERLWFKMSHLSRLYYGVHSTGSLLGRKLLVVKNKNVKWEETVGSGRKDRIDIHLSVVMRGGGIMVFRVQTAGV